MNGSPHIADHASRILIVDDEPHNRRLLEVMLAPEGFLLRPAASGEEALRAIESCDRIGRDSCGLPADCAIRDSLREAVASTLTA